MEASEAVIRFRALFCWLVIIVNNFTSNVECSNYRTITFINYYSGNCVRDEHLKEVNCEMANFREFPKDISPDTLSLILDGNPLEHVLSDSFVNLRNLQNLSLRDCGEIIIDVDAFYPLRRTLRVLKLSKTTVLYPKDYSFLGYMTNIEYLDLSDTDIQYPVNMCDLHPSLKYLYLKENQITRFDSRLMCSSLIRLDLGKNLIRHFFVESLSKLKPNVRELRLASNKMYRLKNNSLLLFPKLESLDLSHHRVTKFEPLAFRSDSLKTIRLYDTRIFLEQNDWSIFHHFPNIQRIEMGFFGMYYEDLTRVAFQYHFHGIRNLKYLDLTGTGITSLSHMFANLSNLKSLRLGENPMPTLTKEDFDGIADSLRELDLSSGKLTEIIFESLPLKVWRNLRVVDFSDNPFACDCDFVWLRRWLKRANASGVEVRGWNKYYCQTPKGQVSIFELKRPSDTECFHDPLFDDPGLLTVLLLTSLIWIATSMASALHRFRWHLRYWYFMRTIKAKKRAAMIPDGVNPNFFTYDVFVGYNRSDFNWLITQLLPRLEQECNLRLCIHERDWLPGRDIAENILESIDNSRKTLLIVSNAFALSPWCHFELTMAQTRLMEEDRDSLVLILLEEIADCNLTPRLQIQMQRRTYIEWTKQSNVGQQLFWANLKHALAKPSDSLMNESLSISLLK